MHKYLKLLKSLTEPIQVGLLKQCDSLINVTPQVRLGLLFLTHMRMARQNTQGFQLPGEGLGFYASCRFSYLPTGLMTLLAPLQQMHIALNMHLNPCSSPKSMKSKYIREMECKNTLPSTVKNCKVFHLDILPL